MVAFPYNIDWSELKETLPKGIDYDQYEYKHSLLYRDRSGCTPKLRLYMENVTRAVYSNTFSDKSLQIIQNNDGKLKITLTI